MGAAGNGNEDLDGAAYATYRDRGNSNAIIVGAGTADANHDRCEPDPSPRCGWGGGQGSTYGARVNVQAWGEDVFTLGYKDFANSPWPPGFVGYYWCHDGTRFVGKCTIDAAVCWDTQPCTGVGNTCDFIVCEYDADCEAGQTCQAEAHDRRQRYTDSFGATSSATPMVASAAVAIQSYAAKELGCKFGPRGMRKLLMDTGIAQGAGGHIGPFPDLKAAIDKVDTLTDCNYGSFNDACDGGDYGDAPDPTYPSLGSSDGPYHLDVTKEWIGDGEVNTTTVEVDSNQIDADLDDGEWFFAVTPAGESMRLIYFATVVSFDPVLSGPEDGTRYLNVLVDLDDGGTWDGGREWPVRNYVVPFDGLPAGVNTLTLAIAVAQTPAEIYYYADHWTRVTLSTEPVADGSGAWGEFARGETEDGLSEIRGEDVPGGEPLPEKLDGLTYGTIIPRVEYKEERIDPRDGARVGLDVIDPDAWFDVKFAADVTPHSWRMEYIERTKDWEKGNLYMGHIWWDPIPGGPLVEVIELPWPQNTGAGPSAWQATDRLLQTPQFRGSFQHPHTGGRSDFQLVVWTLFDPPGGYVMLSVTRRADDLADDPEVPVIEASLITEPPTPTVSQWGMVVLGVLLLAGIAIKFGRRSPAAKTA